MGRQLNFMLSDRYELALRNLATRDELSLAEVVRPALEEYLDRELANDALLARSVDDLLASRRGKKAAETVVSDHGEHRAKKDQTPP